MNKLYQAGVAFLCAVSGTVLVTGMTSYNPSNIHTRYIKVAGAIIGAIVGFAYYIKGGPLPLY